LLQDSQIYFDFAGQYWHPIFFESLGHRLASIKYQSGRLIRSKSHGIMNMDIDKPLPTYPEKIKMNPYHITFEIWFRPVFTEENYIIFEFKQYSGDKERIALSYNYTSKFYSVLTI